MSVTAQQRSLLEAVVRQVPGKLNVLFSEVERRDQERGLCSTYSRILAEVLGEFGIGAQVRPVYVVTADRIAFDAIEGKISKEEAVRRGGKVQIWGDIKYGQTYQHAVCFITEWNVVIDLAMTRRASGLVPSHPYWAVVGQFPWWIVEFQFKAYWLDYQGYETMPEQVRRAKDIIRDVVRRYW